MKIELSFDDAHKQDLRVAGLLDTYGLRGMFYVPAINRGRRGQAGLSDAEVRELSLRHDIGFHSWNHPHDIKTIEEPAEIYRQVTHGRKHLEEVIGRPITSFCYPRGKYDDRVVQAVKDSGFVESRTVDLGVTSLDFDPFRKPTTVHVYPDHKEYGGLPWWKYAQLKLEEAAGKPDGYFHLWGHGWEVEKFNLWEELEHMFSIIQSFKK